MAGNAALSLDMYLPSFPNIAADFSVTEGDVQVTMSTFLLGFAIGQLFYGPISDSFGRRVVVLSSMAVYSMISALCASSASIGELANMRLLQGLAGAAGSVLGRAIIGDVYRGTELAKAMSMLMLVLTAAPMAAPLIGSFVLALAGWRAIFWTLAGYAMLWSFLILLFVPETLPQERRLPLKLSTIMRVFKDIILHKQAMGYILATSLGFAGMFAYIAATPFIYISFYGISPQQYALFFAVNVVGMSMSSVINRLLASTKTVRDMMSIWLVVLIASACVLLINSLIGVGGIWGLAIPLFFYVGCLSALAANGITGMLQHFGQTAGTASSVFGLMQFGSGSIACLIIALFSNGTPAPMGLIIFFCALLAIGIFRLTNAQKKPG